MILNSAWPTCFVYDKFFTLALSIGYAIYFQSPEELFVALLSLITETAYYNAYAATTPHDLESTDASPKGQNPSLSAVRKASSLLTSGAPLEPPGSHTCYPLHLAITANCTPLLPLLLAAGAPLTATRDGLGPVQLAWLTPDITTWVAVLVTRVSGVRLRAGTRAFI